MGLSLIYIMNIREAKNQIKQSIDIYLAKDNLGNYKIPIEKQRPIFLLGAPGIGKTAIMEQIADELGIALVSYSMTHHTRQSALGLPFIVKKNFDGTEYSVSEYTMSEIIASVYETRESTGKVEGILFLDEINCVSETLAPSMLQFLQYKVFGNHRVPEGWVVVTAGNPPEYNRSVHEFDVVTLDRLKVIEAEPDLETWKLYAKKKGIHNSIQTYLDIKSSDFYVIETTVDGKSYVTARGWEDLSEAIFLYEEKGYTVDESLISQYIRNKRVAGEFATYYSLYLKYKSDYGIMSILEKGADEKAIARAHDAAFDERITVVGLMIEGLIPMMRDNTELFESLKKLFGYIKNTGANDNIIKKLSETEEALQKEYEQKIAGGILDLEGKREYKYAMAFVEETVQALRIDVDGDGAFNYLQTQFNEKVKNVRANAADIKNMLNNAFEFIEKAYGDGNEMLLFVTELTISRSGARFIAENGCDKYYKYNKKLMLDERNTALLEDIKNFEKMIDESEEIDGI